MRKLLLTGIALVAIVGVSSAQKAAKKATTAPAAPTQEVKKQAPAVAPATSASKTKVLTAEEKKQLEVNRESLRREAVEVVQEKKATKAN